MDTCTSMNHHHSREALMGHSFVLTCKQDKLFGLQMLYIRYHSLTSITFGMANSTEFFHQFWFQLQEAALPVCLRCGRFGMDSQARNCSTLLMFQALQHKQAKP